MDNKHFLLLSTVFLLLCTASGRAEAPIHLINRGLELQIEPSAGMICGIQNRLTNTAYEVSEAEAFELTIDGLPLTPSEMRLSTAGNKGQPQFTFRGRDLEVIIGFRSNPEQRFVEKTLQVTNRGTRAVELERVLLEKYRLSASQLLLHPHYDPTIFRWLINVFMQSDKGGLYLGIENPFVELKTHFAQGPSTGIAELSYQPNWRLQPGETFESEPAFLGAYQNEGIYAFKELGRLASTLRNYASYPPTNMRLEQEVLDWGAIWAMQQFVEAIEPQQEYKRPGYYLRAIGPAKDVPSSEAFADTVGTIGFIPNIEWNIWIPGEDPRSPAVWVDTQNGQPHFQANASWVQIVQYAQKKGIFSGTSEAVPNGYFSARKDWLVLDRDGKPLGKGDRVCLADGDFVRWYADQYDQLVNQFDLYMLAWDSPAWLWLNWPDPTYECYASNHGHPPGNVIYYAWRNLDTLFAELHRRHPRLAMRIAAGLQPGYPWILKNLIEHHNGFFDNEPGASWWRSLNYRFIPPYKATTTMAAGNWQELKYNFFRSLSLADKAMIWENGLPLQEDQRQFFRKWVQWADQHVAYLRVRRDLFREPWGDDFINRNHVDMEGNFPWPDPQIHGSAHCIKSQGFLFLFNPSPRVRVASIPLNHWIGLREGEQFTVRGLFPEGKDFGTYRREDHLKLAVAPGTAMLLEISPAATAVRSAPPALPADAPVDKAFYTWGEIPWAEIMLP